MLSAHEYRWSSILLKIFASLVKPRISMVHEIAIENVQMESMVRMVLRLLRSRLRNGREMWRKRSIERMVKCQMDVVQRRTSKKTKRLQMIIGNRHEPKRSLIEKNRDEIQLMSIINAKSIIQIWSFSFLLSWQIELNRFHLQTICILWMKSFHFLTLEIFNNWKW